MSLKQALPGSASATAGKILLSPRISLAHPGYTRNCVRRRSRIRATRRLIRATLAVTHFIHFASPSDFSALPLSSLSAFMNYAKPGESR
jgi:hypothetical protein